MAIAPFRTHSLPSLALSAPSLGTIVWSGGISDVSKDPRNHVLVGIGLSSRSHELRLYAPRAPFGQFSRRSGSCRRRGLRIRNVKCRNSRKEGHQIHCSANLMQ